MIIKCLNNGKCVPIHCWTETVGCGERERERERVRAQKLRVLDRVEANLGRGSCTLKARQEVLKERAK